LNPVGYKLMKVAPNWLAKRPYIAEHDLSGVVVDANGCEELKFGDEVYGWIPSTEQFKTHQGALAQYAAVPAVNLVHRPPNLSEVQAAGVTLTSMTALLALDEAKLEEGQTLFVNGGSTAVGSFAIQLAKLRGARVVASASKKNESFVRSLGADEFIDYTSVGPLHTHLAQSPPSTKYNVMLEAVGMFDPSLYTHSSAYLAPNGVFVTVGPMPQHILSLNTLTQGLKLVGAMTLPSFLTGIKPKYKIIMVKPKQEDLKRLHAYFSEGKIKATVDSVYAFEDALKAYDKIISGGARGKVTVNVDLPTSVETAR